MTTRHFAPLLVGTAALVLVIGSLLAGGTTSAAGGKGDRSAPTTPTNLKASNITTSSITLSWTSSTDNSGSLTYKLRITNLNNPALNSLATVSQSQTTYTAKLLASNNPYTFSVYAIDAAGNKSTDSNIVSVSTLADPTPPAGPTLTATVLNPSQVQLTWTAISDLKNSCCNFSVNLNGSPYTGPLNWVAAPAGSLSLTIRHLTPATAYSFSISVTDWYGRNVSTSNIVSATTQPSSDVTPPSPPTNVRLVQDDSCGEIWLGWVEATDNADPQAYIEYEIYVNGVLSPMPVSSGIDVDFVYGTNYGDNYFQVKAVDRSGNTSAPSNLLILYLWPC